MAVNKNFVVKNGLEVNTQLIRADATTNKVGIASTAPRFELDVAGGIGATDIYAVGVATALEKLQVGSGGQVLTVIAGAAGVGTSKVGIGTSNPDYLLEVRSPVSTGQTALYVYGDLRVTGDIDLDDINLDDASIQNLTVTEAFNVTSSGISTFDSHVNFGSSLVVTGISTFGGYVDVNAAADFSNTVNVGGATTLGGYVDVNAAADFSGTVNVVGVTTINGVKFDPSGIITAPTVSGIVTYYGDGSQLDGVIGGIGLSVPSGQLGFGVTFINLLGSSISTTNYDASLGIATIFFDGGGAGGSGSGIGTGLSEIAGNPLQSIYYVNNTLEITETVTVQTPTTATVNDEGFYVAYTNYADIHVLSGFDFIVAADTELILDVFSLKSFS